jgi:hypothetical protein
MPTNFGIRHAQEGMRFHSALAATFTVLTTCACDSSSVNNPTPMDNPVPISILGQRGDQSFSPSYVGIANGHVLPGPITTT